MKISTLVIILLILLQITAIIYCQQPFEQKEKNSEETFVSILDIEDPDEEENLILSEYTLGRTTKRRRRRRRRSGTPTNTPPQPSTIKPTTKLPSTTTTPKEVKGALLWAKPFSKELTGWKVTKQWGEENRRFTSGGGVMEVIYPKGSVNPGSKPIGGTGFYANPLTKRDSLTLQYKLCFPSDFEFVKGGKLPGLYGGTVNSGGNRPKMDGKNGWSTRYMWRREGVAEVYSYIYSIEKKGSNFGFPLYFMDGANKWKFQKGKCYTLKQTVKLNKIGSSDGYIKVWVDGILRVSRTGISYRKSSSLAIEGIMFSTFFGGSDKSWAPSKTVKTQFSDFQLSTE